MICILDGTNWARYAEKERNKIKKEKKKNTGNSLWE